MSVHLNLWCLKDQNANILSCDYFKALPFLDRKLISRSHEKMLWSWGLLSLIKGLSWTFTEVTNQQKQKRKGNAILIKRKGDFHCLGGLWIRTLEVFMREFMLCITEVLINFPVRDFLTSFIGMWSWLHKIPLYQRVSPSYPIIPWVFSLVSHGMYMMWERMYLIHEIIPSSYYISMLDMVFIVSSRNNFHGCFTDLYCVIHFSRSNWI